MFITRQSATATQDWSFSNNPERGQVRTRTPACVLLLLASGEASHGDTDSAPCLMEAWGCFPLYQVHSVSFVLFFFSPLNHASEVLVYRITRLWQMKIGFLGADGSSPQTLRDWSNVCLSDLKLKNLCRKIQVEDLCNIVICGPCWSFGGEQMGRIGLLNLQALPPSLTWGDFPFAVLSSSAGPCNSGWVYWETPVI